MYVQRLAYIQRTAKCCLTLKIHVIVQEHTCGISWLGLVFQLHVAFLLLLLILLLPFMVTTAGLLPPSHPIPCILFYDTNLGLGLVFQLHATFLLLLLLLPLLLLLLLLLFMVTTADLLPPSHPVPCILVYDTNPTPVLLYYIHESFRDHAFLVLPGSPIFTILRPVKCHESSRACYRGLHGLHPSFMYRLQVQIIIKKYIYIYFSIPIEKLK